MIALQSANRHKLDNEAKLKAANQARSHLSVAQHLQHPASPPEQLLESNDTFGAYPELIDPLFNPYPSPEPDDDSDSDETNSRTPPQLNALINGEPEIARTPEPPEIPSDDIYHDDEPNPALGAAANLDSADLAPGFRESPAVRLLYLQTVVGNIFGSRTVLDSNNALTDGLDLIELAASTAGIALTHIIKPAQTLTTAKRRLGLEVDDYIEKRPICTICYKHYSLDEIKRLPSPNCTVARCNGIVYRVKRRAEHLHDDSDENEIRTPAKIMPYISLIKGLGRMLLRPSFVNNLVPYDQAYAADDSKQMHDIQDSPVYNSLKIGLKRVVDEDGSVRDVEDSPGSCRLLSSVDVGLSLTLNMDW